MPDEFDLSAEVEAELKDLGDDEIKALATQALRHQEKQRLRSKTPEAAAARKKYQEKRNAKYARVIELAKQKFPTLHAEVRQQVLSEFADNDDATT